MGLGGSALGSVPGLDKSPIGTLGNVGGANAGGDIGGMSAQGPFVGFAGTQAVEDLAKQVQKGSKEQADATNAAAKAIATEQAASTNQATTTGTGWLQYLGNLSYDLLPRVGVLALAVVFAALGLWLIGHETESDAKYQLNCRKKSLQKMRPKARLCAEKAISTKQ